MHCAWTVHAKVWVRHSQGPPLPGFTTPRVRHSQGPPLPGSATPRVRHFQGEPLYTVSEHFINSTSVSANRYFLFQLLLALWFFIDLASTDAMVIQHIFRKNSCTRIQLLVSVKVALFHHSNFYLYSTLFASPASIYTVFFSLVLLLLIKSLSSLTLLCR